MILADKCYIETPPDGTSLMHYLDIYQLLSILNFKKIVFSAIPLYKDKREATLSIPSYINVLNHLLVEDNTPVKKNECYDQRKQEIIKYTPLNIENIELLNIEDIVGLTMGLISPSDFEDNIEVFDSEKHTLSDFDESIYPQRKDNSFAALIRKFARHFMFAHCWSETKTESILMWDRYGRLNSTVAIKTTIGRIKNAFVPSLDTQMFPMYIGKIKYIDYKTEHITGFDDYANKDLSDPNIIEELFYQPMFHKQKLYRDENEVRIIISYDHFLKHENRLYNSHLSNIPYYDDHWGFKYDRDPDDSFDDNALIFSNGLNKLIKPINRIWKQPVDINELIEQIIISPYAEPYVSDILKTTACKCGFDPEHVVNSSIEIR